VKSLNKNAKLHKVEKNGFLQFMFNKEISFTINLCACGKGRKKNYLFTIPTEIVGAVFLFFFLLLKNRNAN
jgi:hypothetical protein